MNTEKMGYPGCNKWLLRFLPAWPPALPGVLQLPLLALILLTIMNMSAFAQTNDEYKKFEFFAGYSFSHADTFYTNIGYDGFYNLAQKHHGFNVSAVYNVNRYFGVKADMSGIYNQSQYAAVFESSNTSLFPGTLYNFEFRTSNSFYNFLGGIQVKDNTSERRLKPFVHALLGAGYKINLHQDGDRCFNMTCAGSLEKTGLAAALGGGLDIHIYKRIAVRVFQVDYNPVKFRDVSYPIHANTRISTGIVF